MPGIEVGSRMGSSSGQSMIGGVIQRDHAARFHKFTDEGGVMNHRENRLPEVLMLPIHAFIPCSSAFHQSRSFDGPEPAECILCPTLVGSRDQRSPVSQPIKATLIRFV
jgi:hypothetical protein